MRREGGDLWAKLGQLGYEECLLSYDANKWRMDCISWHEKKSSKMPQGRYSIVPIRLHVGEANNLCHCPPRDCRPITGLISAAAPRPPSLPPFKRARFFSVVLLSRSAAHLLSRVTGASDRLTVSRIHPTIRACGLRRGGIGAAVGSGGVASFVPLSPFLIRRCIQTSGGGHRRAVPPLPPSLPSRSRWM